MVALLKEIEERRAKRALSDKEISAETIERIMTAATYAPSCNNSQPWRLMVVTDHEALGKIKGSLSEGNYWAQKAPMIVVVATKIALDAKLSDNREYALFDCGLATENLLLQATKEGLYSHPMAGFDPMLVKEAFAIPGDYIVIALIALGYPGPADHLNEKHQLIEQSKRGRKPSDQVICYNNWSLKE